MGAFFFLSARIRIEQGALLCNAQEFAHPTRRSGCLHTRRRVWVYSRSARNTPSARSAEAILFARKDKCSICHRFFLFCSNILIFFLFCAIIKVPNKFHKQKCKGYLSFSRESYAFFVVHITLWIWQKCNLRELWCKGYPLLCLKFVWRQSEFAFFGASASVGALFS